MNIKSSSKSNENWITRAILTIVFSSISVIGASAATITVVSTNDSGAGSLREAIFSAASGDTIDFNLSGCPCTISLTSAELTIDNKNLFINGPGASQLTISGNNARRVFRITSRDASFATISGVTIANGSAPGGGGIFVEAGGLSIFNSVVSGNASTGNSTGFGGGILVGPMSSLNVVGTTISNNSSAANGGGISTTSTLGSDENIKVANSTISNNTARFGGGVYVFPTGTLTSVNSSFNNNMAMFEGGGIYNAGNASLTKVGIQTNTASGTGGGIYSSGALTITDSMISGNQSIGGGGINSTNTLTVSRSTISGNSVVGNGGGINIAGTASVANSTFSGNQVTGGTALGGGINASSNSTVNLKSCTVVLNSSVFRGGGTSSETNAIFNVSNSIIAQNTAPNRGPDGHGIFISGGFNLIGDGAFANGFTNGVKNDLVGGNGQPVLDPLIVPLADNGGATQTHALQAASPAIDKGDGGFGIVTDQRGNPRFIDAAAAPNIPGGNNSDIGAFEFIAPSAASVGVGGRVLSSERRGLSNAGVILIDSDGNVRSANTSTFGYFKFPEVEVGETYVILVRSKSYRFAPQIITIKDEISEMNLVATP